MEVSWRCSGAGHISAGKDAVINSLVFIHIVSVVIYDYFLIGHSFSFLWMGDTISLLRFRNEHPDQEPSTWGQLINLNERSAAPLATVADRPNCPVAWPSDPLWPTKQRGEGRCYASGTVFGDGGRRRFTAR